ncbi:hypothetical protein [Streptomyces megasporus]|uniref:hypothetical protein n=1 Tax=Streptomyces megasporus TaxID=44060 RepID=UPI0004E16425|nr:hypothetical protein [Streptomyces megasporus]
MRTKWFIGCLLVAALTTGCNPLSSEPDNAQPITQTTLPPDPDQSASKQSAQAFIKARANEDGTIHELGPSIERIFGDWEKGGNRAFIATNLDGSLATPENGRRIANTFADWQNSESGEGQVSVYDKSGKLLYMGPF